MSDSNLLYFDLHLDINGIVPTHHTIKIPEGNTELKKVDLKLTFRDIPNPLEGNVPISSIDVWDNKTKQYRTFKLHGGKKMISNNSPIIVECMDEFDIILNFLDVYRKTYPDYLVGYNISGFDLPYLLKRIQVLLAEPEVIKTLIADHEDHVTSILTRMKKATVLDVLNIYRNRVDSPTYTLDYVCINELGISKRNYSDLEMTIRLGEHNDLIMDAINHSPNFMDK